MLYEYKCPDCALTTVMMRPMKDRHLLGVCASCGIECERVHSVPYVTPESAYVSGGIASRGRKIILNDVDDPWEGSGTALCAEMSEEFVAKGKEARGEPKTSTKVMYT